MTLIAIAQEDVIAYPDGPLVPVFARLYANIDFRSSEGVFVAKGSEKNPAFYQEFGASMNGDNIRIAAGDAYSTTDALEHPEATYSLVVYDGDGEKIKTVFSALRIPPDDPATSWAVIQAYSRGRFQPRPSTYLDSNAILAMNSALANSSAANAAAVVAAQLGPLIEAKQDALVNQSNIKSVNDITLLGAGNLKVSDKLLASNYASLAAAIAAIGSTPAILQLDGNATVSTAIVVPATLYIEPIKGSTITKSGAGTIEFAGLGVLNAELPVPVFSGFSAGNISWTGSEYPGRIAADLWANANWSDRLNNATGAFTNKDVTIVVYPGAITAQSRIKSGQSIHFTAGEYTDNYSGTQVTRFVLESNTSVYGDGMGRTILTQNALTNNERTFAADAMVTGGFNGANENIEIRDLAIEGSGGTFHDDGASAIILGNCHNGIVQRVRIKEVLGYGVGVGGFASAGNYAKNCYVLDCIFDDVHGQNVFGLNCENVVVSRNIFSRINKQGTSFITAVDFEPNVPADRIKNITISDNIFDGDGSTQLWNAIVVQSASAFSMCYGVIVADNIIRGEGVSGGVQLSGCVNAQVSSNLIQGAGQAGVDCYRTFDSYIRNNHLRLCGTGGVRSMQFTACGDNFIDGNILHGSQAGDNRPGGIVEFESTTTVNTNGTAVTRTSGTPFLPEWVGRTVTISGSDYVVQAVAGLSNLTLTATAGVQSGVTLTTKFSNNQYSNNHAAHYVLLHSSKVVSAMNGVIHNSLAVSFTANQNNYSPVKAFRYDITTDASRNITGLRFDADPQYINQTNGDRHEFYNAGSNNLVIKHEDAGTTTAANRFHCNTGADITLAAGQTADLEYNSTLARWMVSRRVDGTLAPLVSPNFTTPNIGAAIATSVNIGSGTVITKVVKGTVTVDPASVNADTVSSQTFTLTGAVVGDSLILNPPAAGLTAGMVVGQWFVSDADQITIVFFNQTGAPIDLASADWNYTLIRS